MSHFVTFTQEKACLKPPIDCTFFLYIYVGNLFYLCCLLSYNISIAIAAQASASARAWWWFVKS